jgi:hypothetical protein
VSSLSGTTYTVLGGVLSSLSKPLGLITFIVDCGYSRIGLPILNDNSEYRKVFMESGVVYTHTC